LCFVHLPVAEAGGTSSPAAATTAPDVLRDASVLPPEVRRMREAITGAAMSGDIEALRIPIQMNEIPPVFGKEKITDAVAFLKQRSGDGEGREMLAILVQLFRTGFVRKYAGTPNEMIVWPYFAETPLDKLTPSQQVELLTLVPPARVKEMRAKGKYDGYRIGISAKGVWHYFGPAE
jgi:hypothetical protein